MCRDFWYHVFHPKLGRVISMKARAVLDIGHTGSFWHPITSNYTFEVGLVADGNIIWSCPMVQTWTLIERFFLTNSHHRAVFPMQAEHDFMMLACVCLIKGPKVCNFRNKRTGELG